MKKFFIKIINQILRIKAPEGESLYIGKIKNKFFQKEFLSQKELNHHVHILGASGFGKTVLLSKILKDQLQKGHGALFLDQKGDREDMGSLISEVEKLGRKEDLKVFSLAHKDLMGFYNIIGEGNATELCDRIMDAFNWSEEFYKNQAKSYLLKLLTVLVWLRDQEEIGLDLKTVYRGISSLEFVEELCLKVPESERQLKNLIEDCYRYLSDKNRYHNLSGLSAQLESLLLTNFGNCLTENENGINLFEAVNSQKIVFIFLDTRRYRVAAPSLAKFILRDLIATSARIDAEVPKHQRKPFVCFIDEFADIADEGFTAFPDRARSSKMSLVLSHQELSDLKKVSETFAARLTGNISTLYAFLQANSESAETIAARAGTQRVVKSTYRTSRFLWWQVPTGERSERETEEFLIHPNVVKRLGVGECVVIKKYPTARAWVVKVDEK